MRSYHAIYDNGHLHFQFRLPDNQGPVAVLVVFPEAWDDPHMADLDPFDPERDDVPN